MVKHHKKSKKKNKGSKQKIDFIQESLKDLDRFAGSSEEEEEEEEDVDKQIKLDVNDEPVHDTTEDNNINIEDTKAELSRNQHAQALDDGDEADEEISDKNDDKDDDNYSDSSAEDEYGQGKNMEKNEVSVEKGSNDQEDAIIDGSGSLLSSSQSGMAGAMGKILGLSSTSPGTKTAMASKTKTTKPVVLSKTTTPLQRQQKKEKEQMDALRLKRKQRREIHLTSMHIPLSVANSRPIGQNGDSDLSNAIAKEIEQERSHRRVATRGVVALFNTISKHQQQRAQNQNEFGTTTKKNDEVKSMTKYKFLDMLKNTGGSDNKDSNQNNEKPEPIVDNRTSSSSTAKGNKTSWNALKDDFMMNTKLKDWDKALSSSDESLDDNRIASREETGQNADDDALIDDDDWSSDEDVRTTSSKRTKLSS